MFRRFLLMSILTNQFWPVWDKTSPTVGSCGFSWPSASWKKAAPFCSISLSGFWRLRKSSRSMSSPPGEGAGIEV